MKRKDVVVRAPPLGCLCLYNAPHPAQLWVERDISGAINDVGRLRTLLIFADISSMRHLHVCSHTKSFLFA